MASHCLHRARDRTATVRCGIFGGFCTCPFRDREGTTANTVEEPVQNGTRACRTWKVQELHVWLAARMRLFCTSTALNSRVPLAHGGGKKRTAPPSSLVMWIMLIGSCWESLAAAEWCQDSKAARNAWLHHHAVWDQLVAGCEAATAMFHLDDLPSAKTLFRVLWRWMTGCEKMGNWWSVEREGGESEWRRTCPYCTAVQESAAMPRPKSYTVLVA